jgi:hypothetical protein
LDKTPPRELAKKIDAMHKWWKKSLNGEVETQESKELRVPGRGGYGAGTGLNVGGTVNIAKSTTPLRSGATTPKLSPGQGFAASANRDWVSDLNDMKMRMQAGLLKRYDNGLRLSTLPRRVF